MEKYSLHVRSSLLFLPICYLPQYMDSDANDFTGNDGNKHTGEAWEYLKKLITAMGATFARNMTSKNTVFMAALNVPFPLLFPLPLPFFLLLPIISSFSPFLPVFNHYLIPLLSLSGTKATRALSWSIPVVNHTCLEDCFVQWRNLTVGMEKYIVSPPGVDLSTLLGERGLGVEWGIEEEVKEMGDDDDEWGEREGGVQEAETLSGTDASMREVQGLIDGDVHMVDEEREEQYGMDMDGSAPGEEFRLDDDNMTRRRCTACGQVQAQRRFIVREESTCSYIIIKPFILDYQNHYKEESNDTRPCCYSFKNADKT